MTKKPLHFISDTELEKAYKRSKVLTIVQGVLVFTMLATSIAMTIGGGVSVFTFLPLFFAPMVIAGIIQMKQFKKEMERRKNS